MSTELGAFPPLSEDELGLPGPSIGERVLDREERRRPFRAFHHVEFRLLFVAYGIGDLGFWISHISLQSEMARVTGTSSLWLGLLFFTTFIPMLLFAPLAGVVADRVDRKRMLVATRAAVGLVATALSIVVLSDLGRPGVLAGFGFLIGSLFAFMAPAAQSATANAVPSEDLTSAVAMESTGANISRIAGPALAAPILAAWGAGWSFAVYAISNALMVLVLLPIRLKARQDATETGTSWQRWKHGLQHARERPPAIAALVTMSIFSMFGAAHVALLPVFTTQVLDHPRDDFTILVIASGVGAILGTIGIGLRKAPPTMRTAVCWMLGFAAGGAAFALSSTWELSLVFVSAMGLCYFSIAVSLNTVLQQLADDEKRGRIMGLFAVAWAGLIPFGGIWMGAVANVASAPAAIGIGAGVCATYAVLYLLRSTRAGRVVGPQASIAPPR